MEDYSPLVRRPTISRQSGPTYLDTYATKGIHVYYKSPIPIPDPITLPVGWVLPQLNDNRFRIDLSTERQVLEQANLRRQAIAGEAVSPHSLRGNICLPPGVTGIPLIPYQSSTILTPIPASSSDLSHVSGNVQTNYPSRDLDVPLGEMSLRDFEGESDPFEVTALQAIDVFSELQSVLQPQTTTSQTIDVPSTAQLSSSQHISSPSQPSVYPTPPVSSEGFYDRNTNGLLVDVGGGGGGDQRNESTPSIHYPLPPVPPSVRLPPPSSVRLPPPVPPKPTSRTVSSPNTSHRPFAGVAVLPSIDQLPRQQPPPPYSSEPISYSSYRPSPPLAPRGYSLPDVRNTLSSDEVESLQNISGMGFPVERVARAIKQFESDDQKVFDFLLQVGAMEESGYSGVSGETALLTHEQDMEKSIDYLKQVYQYKEVWPEVKIHEAYQEAGGSWDETVDILTQGR